VKVETRGRNVKAYLDDKLVLNETLLQPDRVLAISGRDDRTGELIVKLLNTSDIPVEVDLDCTGMTLAGAGTLTQLASDDANAENSFDAPRRIAPITTQIQTRKNDLARTLPAHSLSILRLK
jgi:alpha-L-arabinofuranosidase